MATESATPETMDERLAESLEMSGLTFDAAYDLGLKAFGLGEDNALDCFKGSKSAIALFGSNFRLMSSLRDEADASEGLSSANAQE